MRLRIAMPAGLLAGLLAGAAAAQVPDLEPGVQTSPATAPAAPAAPAAVPAGKAGKGGAAAKREHDAPPDKAAAPAQAPSPAQPQAQSTAVKPGSKDRIELDTTQISGNRELPKVMYVVPWRKADPGEFAGRPPNSLLDEALAPVDRDVFRRQNRYYSALQGGAAGTAAESQSGAKPASGPPQETRDEK